MKINFQAHTKISSFILISILSLQTTVAYSQEKHVKNTVEHQKTNVNSKVLPVKPNKAKREKFPFKATLASLPQKKIFLF